MNDVPPEVGEDVPEEAGEETPVCPRCVNEIFPNTHFCPYCLTPLSFLANSAPLYADWAKYWGVGQAATIAWPRPIHVVGLWLAAAPEAALVGWMSVTAHGTWYEHAVTLAWALLIAWTLYVGTRNWIRRPRVIWNDDGPTDAPMPSEVFE